MYPISRIIRSFAHNFDVVEFDINHKKSKKDDEDCLPESAINDISNENEEEYWCIRSSSFKCKTNDGNKCANHPKVMLVICLHDDSAFKVEEEEQ